MLAIRGHDHRPLHHHHRPPPSIDPHHTHPTTMLTGACDLRLCPIHQKKNQKNRHMSSGLVVAIRGHDHRPAPTMDPHHIPHHHADWCLRSEAVPATKKHKKTSGLVVPQALLPARGVAIGRRRHACPLRGGVPPRNFLPQRCGGFDIIMTSFCHIWNKIKYRILSRVSQLRAAHPHARRGMCGSPGRCLWAVDWCS